MAASVKVAALLLLLLCAAAALALSVGASTTVCSHKEKHCIIGKCIGCRIEGCKANCAAACVAESSAACLTTFQDCSSGCTKWALECRDRCFLTQHCLDDCSAGQEVCTKACIDEV